MNHKVKTIALQLGMCALFLLVLLMPPAGQVQAVDYRYWIGGDGDWSNPAKWDTPPVNGDTAILNSNGAVTYNISDLSLTGLEISTDGNNMTLSHSAGNMTIAGNNSLTINAVNGGTASYDLSGTGILAKEAYEVKIGTDGTGYFNQSGGRFEFSGALYLGEQEYQEDIDGNPTQGYGKYTMTGGDIVAGPTGSGGIVLGEWGGKGEFLQSGGTVTIDNLTLARQVGATGNYTLSGDPSSVTLTVKGPTVVGELGTGTFTQTGGTHTAGNLTLGSSGVNVVLNDDGSYIGHTVHQGNGTYNLSALVPADKSSNLLVQNDLVLGHGGTGVFHHDNGRVTVDGNLILGRLAVHDVWDDKGNYVTTEYLNGTGTYNLTAGELYVTGNTIIGESEGSFGTFNQSGGSHRVEKNLYVDAYAGSKGIYNLSGGGLVVVGDDRAVVGSFGNGEFNQGPGTTPGMSGANDGGIFTVEKHLILGEQAGSTGTYNLSGGTLGVGWYTTVGYSGSGYFNQSGGSHTISGGLILGQTPSGYGEYNLSGYPATSTLTVGGVGTRVGEVGIGIFNQSGGTHTTNGLVLGQSGSGTYNLSGDGSVLSVINNGDIYLGVDGTGTFVQSGNSNVAANNLFIGSSTGSGYYELNGGTLILTGVTSIGLGGTGTFTQTGGTHEVDGTLFLGEGANGIGTYNLGGGELRASWMDVGTDGIGKFTQTGGSVNVANNLVIGRNSTGANTYTLSGDVDTVKLTTGQTHVGVVGTGTFAQSGGTHSTGTLALGFDVGGRGTYELKDGSLSSDYQRIGLDGTGTFIQTGGSNDVKETVKIAQNTGSTGTYDMQGGELKAKLVHVGQGGHFINAGGTVMVAQTNNYGTVSGSGTFIGNVTNYGTVAPGSSPGILTINGDYTQDPSGTLNIELFKSSSGAGTGYDQLNVSGLAKLGGTINLAFLSGYDITEGDTFDILLYGTRSGEFATWLGLDPAGSLYFTYDYRAGDLTLTAHTAPVPVPPSVWLLGSGLLGLFGLRRRFRK